MTRHCREIVHTLAPVNGEMNGTELSVDLTPSPSGRGLG